MDSQQPQQQPSESADTKGKVTNDERNLVVAFIQFLRHKVSSNQCTDDQIEGLEVAVQCLETAFEVTDKSYAFQSSRPLLDIFVAAEGLASKDEEFPTPTQAELEQANKLKEEGNELVKAGQYDTAIAKYNEAIKLSRDPIFFCNRAAVYCRLEQYDLAIQDCRTALALDSQYAKAYGRMGVALSCQNRYDQAVEAYKKALEIDPSNESYRQNLSIAENKLAEAQAAVGGNAQNPMGAMGGFGPFGPAGLGGLLNNPQMMQMASQMMTDPNIQNFMGQMMQNFMGGAAPPPGGMAGAGGGMPGGGGNDAENHQQAAGGVNPLGNLLRAGESLQLAAQMEQANPELVEQLRRQFGTGLGGGGANPPQGPQDPPNDNSGGGGNGPKDGAPKPPPPAPQ